MTDDTELSDLLSEPLEFDDCIKADEVYIKREVRNFRPIYSVYDSQGELLAYASTRQEARRFVQRNELNPQDVN